MQNVILHVGKKNATIKAEIEIKYDILKIINVSLSLRAAAKHEGVPNRESIFLCCFFPYI